MLNQEMPVTETSDADTFKIAAMVEHTTYVDSSERVSAAPESARSIIDAAMAAGEAEGIGLTDALIPLAIPDMVDELVREGVAKGVRVDESERVFDGVNVDEGDVECVLGLVCDDEGDLDPGSPLVRVWEPVCETEGVSEEDGDAVAPDVCVMLGDGERVGVAVASGENDGVAVSVPLLVCEGVDVEEGDIVDVAVTDAEIVLDVEGSEIETIGVYIDVRNDSAES